MTSERVDAQGVAKLAQVLQSAMGSNMVRRSLGSAEVNDIFCQATHAQEHVAWFFGAPKWQENVHCCMPSCGLLGIRKPSSELLVALSICALRRCAMHSKFLLRRVHAQKRTLTQVLPMASEADLQLWQRLDDVIMGGQSSSTLRADGDGSAVFSGTLVLEGGGFCGARTNVRHPTCSLVVNLAMPRKVLQ